MTSLSLRIDPLPDEGFLAPGDFLLDRNQMTVGIALLDHPRIQNPFPRLPSWLLPSRPLMPSFFDLLSQHRQHRRRDRRGSIRNEKGIRFFHPALFHFFQQADDALLLVLVYVRRHAQFGIALYATPHVELADGLRVILLGEVSVFFLTNVHNSSSWASLR